MADEHRQDGDLSLRLALSAARMSTWICELPSGAMTWSEEGEALRGFNKGEFDGTLQSCLNKILPVDALQVRRAIDEVVAGRTAIYQVEYRVSLPDGQVRWLDSRGEVIARDPEGKPVRMAGVATDITASKAAERDLALTREWIDGAPDAFFRVAKDGRIVDVNRAACAMYGYTREELLNLRLWDISGFSEQVFARMFDELRLLKSRTREAVAITKDGTSRAVEVSANHVEYGGEEFSCASIRDITARKDLEEQLRQGQKMEAIGRLAGGVAHDFNNLLSVILSYGELALAELAQDHAVRDDVEQIQKAAKRAAALTRQLLMFSRQQVLEPKVVDLNELLSSTGPMLQRIVGEDIEVLSSLAPSLGRIRIDAGSLEQVLMNLVVNARDAMPTGGKLSLETDNIAISEKEAGEHLGAKAGAHVMLSVSDTGSGMDRATQERMFEPFFTTKERGKGTGLGLSTVFGIVQQSGGTIRVQSEPGQGTTFRIYLPQVSSALEAPHAPIPSEVHGSETVLLVEDDDLVRSATRRILKRFGYTVLEAGGADEALRVCAAHPQRIDLLLTDVVMPRVSGPELARKIEALRPGILVLFMSGYTDDSIVRHGVLQAETAFLQKPLSTESLTRKLRELLDPRAAELRAAARQR